MSPIAEELRVQNVADLAPLLVHADPAYRAAAYTSILENPDKALSLAKHCGKDIIDVLTDMLNGTAARGDRKAILAAVGQFDDPRVNLAFRSVLTEENDDELLHLAAQFVHERALQIDRESVLKLLRCGDNMSKVRIAAELLAGKGLFDTADAIRIAAFGADSEEFPVLSDQTIDAWVSELQGPLQEYLLQVLERRGPAVEIWQGFWSALDADLRIWLARRACYAEPPQHDVILLALADDDRVRLATLVGLRLYETKIEGVTIRRALNDALNSPSPRIRTACTSYLMCLAT